MGTKVKGRFVHLCDQHIVAVSKGLMEIEDL